MQKEQDREAIYRSIFFCDMDRKKADEIINRLDGRTVTYDKGEIIIREREKLNNIGILQIPCIFWDYTSIILCSGQPIFG